MQAYYRSHIGKDPKAIIVKVAHKLVRAMLSVIKNDRPYQINYSAKTKQIALAEKTI